MASVDARSNDRLRMVLRLAIALGFTALIVFADYNSSIGHHTAGGDVRQADEMFIIELALIPIAAVSWAFVFRVRSRWWALALATLMFYCLCYGSFFAAALDSDVFIGTPKRTLQDEYLRRYIVDSIQASVFLVLFGGGCLSLAWYGWNKLRERH